MSEEVTDLQPEDSGNQLLHGSFVKYCSNDRGVIKGIFEDHKIRFTQAAALNDPLEFNPILRLNRSGGKYTEYVFDGVELPSEEGWLRTALIESQLNVYGVLALARDPCSYHMWSHYANGHKGFLLEFKADFNAHPCMLSREGQSYKVRDVEYVDEYAINVEELDNTDGVILFDTFNEQLFYTKASRWREEGEYRMVRCMDDCSTWQPMDDKPHRDLRVHLFDFSLECLGAVVFGACMKKENKRRIMEACKGTDITFAQAYVVRDQKDILGHPGRVRLARVRDCREASPLGDRQCMVCELDTAKEMERPPVEVESLDDLPYYDIDRRRVDLFYATKKASQNQQAPLGRSNSGVVD